VLNASTFTKPKVPETLWPLTSTHPQAILDAGQYTKKYPFI
jgi:hypothetical protein